MKRTHTYHDAMFKPTLTGAMLRTVCLLEIVPQAEIMRQFLATSRALGHRNSEHGSSFRDAFGRFVRARSDGQVVQRGRVVSPDQPNRCLRLDAPPINRRIAGGDIIRVRGPARRVTVHWDREPAHLVMLRMVDASFDHAYQFLERELVEPTLPHDDTIEPWMALARDGLILRAQYTGIPRADREVSL